MFHESRVRVKLTILNALLMLLAGLVLVITGAFLKLRESPLSNPTVFSGLAVDFLGAILLVLGLHRRRRNF
ncbi:hypothetical protein GCM10027275_46010 [Rhabdobacter roseus]|uniref:Putative YccA/Bax inhibitor family protein n=1 Tax=Rhabdobacter roseus TaxID=1655419 RepID=A0A840U4H5_9BACT|nr:hypothetical protein [Rhabdobacter roseus]MBB5286729.1 putative YccA/Bax inhibitor family protein [Rhabdobacter roseus]